jgi:hypothetical protein
MKEKELRVESEVSHDRAKLLRINVSVARLLRGSGCRNLALAGVYEQASPFSKLLPDLLFAELDAHNSFGTGDRSRAVGRAAPRLSASIPIGPRGRQRDQGLGAQGTNWPRLEKIASLTRSIVGRTPGDGVLSGRPRASPAMTRIGSIFRDLRWLISA